MRIIKQPQKWFFDLGAILILISLIFWFGREMIWDDQIPFFRDLNTYFYPLRFSLTQAFKAGELPLWDRHFAMGFPMLADFQSGVFYPPHLFFLALPFIQAIRFVYFFHYLAAVVGSYLLFRHWNYPRYQAMIGALLFTLGGTTVSLINLLNHFQSAVWLPWVILFWERFLLRNSWRNFLILIAIFTVQFLAGSPEIYTMSMALLVLDGIFLLCRTEGPASIWKVLPCLVTANLVVATLTAVQLFPAVELILQSRRQESIPYQEAASWSLNPWSLVNLVFLDKRVDLGQGDGTQLFFDRDIPFLISHYFGAIFIFGMCFWLCDSSLKEKATFGILIALSLGLAFGAFTPIYPFLYKHVSVFRTFRYPEKIFFLTQGFLIVATLRGIFRFQAQNSRLANRMLLIMCFCWASIFFLYLFLRYKPELLAEFIGREKALVLPLHWTLDHVAWALVSLERQLVLLAGFVMLFFVGKNGYIRESIFKFLLVTIVFIDLNWAHQGFQYLLKPETVLYGHRILNAPDVDPNRIFYYPSGKNLHAGAFVIMRPPSTPFGEISSIVAGNLLPNAGVQYGFDYIQDINALAKESYVEFLRFANHAEPQKQFSLLGALNVKYVVSFRPLEGRGITLIQHFPQYPSWLYKINRVLPRAYIVHRTKKEKSSLNALESLSGEHQFDPFAEVLLNKSLPITLSSNSHDEAKILKYGNQDVSIRASSNNPGVLVLADSFYPGWHVYVDGKERKLLRANYFFRAVEIASGEHLVEFKYEPYWFKTGLFVSLGALIILVIISMVLFLKLRWRDAMVESGDRNIVYRPEFSWLSRYLSRRHLPP